MKKGAIDLCLLALIGRGEQSGGELLDALSEPTGLASAGTLYPALARIEKAGLISGERRLGHDGRTRKFYTLTSRGEDALREKAAAWNTVVGGVNRILSGEQT